MNKEIRQRRKRLLSLCAALEHVSIPFATITRAAEATSGGDEATIKAELEALGLTEDRQELREACDAASKFLVTVEPCLRAAKALRDALKG